MMTTTTVTCADCLLRRIGCRDCLASARLDLNATWDLTESQQTALGVLAEHGLLPPLRALGEDRAA